MLREKSRQFVPLYLNVAASLLVPWMNRPKTMNLVCLLFLTFGLVMFFLANAQDSSRPQLGQSQSRTRQDRILVQPKRGVSLPQMAAVHTQIGAEVIKTLTDSENLQVIHVPQGISPINLIARYQKSELVQAAEPDFLVHTSVVPNDPAFLDGTQWGLNNVGQSGGISDADIDAPEGWDTLNSASNIVVAVVDTGIRYTHEDLAANIWLNPKEIAGNGKDDDNDGIVDDIHGINAITGSGDPWDDAGHGTHVAGIIGAVGNNSKGIVGVAWRVQIMACKFMDSTDNGSISDAIQCIDYARTHGAQVINASWGGPNSSSFLQNAISKARQAGIIFVAAAGNDARDNDATPTYPSGFNLDNIVAVAATTHSDTLADYSNFGATTVDLAAPGSAIYSTYNSTDSAYTYLSGTSMATPHVSGALALLRARYSGDTYLQLINRLLAASDPLPTLVGKCVTGGRLNLQKALGPGLVADFTANPTSGNLPLTVNFVDASQGTIAGWLWNFGDGTTSSTVQNPTHVFGREGNFTVTLTVTGANGSIGSKSRLISVVANYRIQATSFNWIDPTGMTTLSFTDNGVSTAELLPFTFNFYGQNYDHIYVAANGMVGFVNQGLDSAANTDLPTAASPNAAIYPYWDDLNPAAGGSVWIGTDGASPSREMVVSWISVPHRSKPPTTLTFQVVLYENSNRIQFQYLDVDPSRNLGAGRSATIGIENETGLIAAKYSYNGSTLISNKQAILFVPSSSGGMSVGPASSLAASGNIGGPLSPGSQVYNVQNTGNSTLNWTASKSQNWVTLSPMIGSLAPGQITAVSVTINPNANSLPAGSYADTITFVNVDNGIGNTTRSVSLAVNGTTAVLTVTPEIGLISSGISGGAFYPLSQIYTLINTGDANLSWSASSTQSWLSLSATSGSLAAGESATVTISINSAAGQLTQGSYSDTLTFANVTNGKGNTSRPVALTVTAPNLPPNVSLSSPADGAMFTASAGITLKAEATDGDGSVSKVAFFAGATLLGTVTNAPYTFIWSNVMAGSYSLTANATDNQGATASSPALNISVFDVKQPALSPEVEITNNRWSFTLLNAIPGAEYQFQISSDLSNWSSLSTIVAQLETVSFTYTGTVGGSEFFRALLIQ